MKNTTNPTKAKVAHKFLSQKLSVIPVTKDKTPYAGFYWKQFSERFPTHDEIESWFSFQFPEANIAIVTGGLSRITVLDIDPRNGGDTTILQNSKLPSVLTPSEGKHVYFKPSSAVSVTKHSSKGYDLMHGGYVLAPPSETNKGKYLWLEEFKRDKLEPFPDYLLEKLGFKSGVSELTLPKKVRVASFFNKPLDTNKAKSFPFDRLLSSAGITLYQSRNGFNLNCPFHEDYKSSAVYYPSSNKVYCFRCSRTFNTIDFLIKKRGLSFIEALKELAQ